MKILFFSQRFLLPMDAGGKIRSGKILEQMTKQHDVTVLSNFEPRLDREYEQGMANLCNRFIPVEWREIKKHSLAFMFRLLLQMFSRYPVSTLNTVSRKLRLALEKEVNDNAYDVIICDFVQAAIMLKNIRSCPSVLFQHNVESVIVQRHYTLASNPLSRFFWWLQWQKMLAYERKQCQQFDAVIAVSDEDRNFFRDNYSVVNAQTIPTGVDIDFFYPQEDATTDETRLVFCGSLDWLPNEDAMIFFIDDVLPALQRSVSDIALTIVGKNPSPALQRRVDTLDNVELTGWVTDTRPHISGSKVCIVPLRIGGGTRMKIYEAMAMGKAVVSTTIGAEGLPVRNGENIVIADDPEEFATQVEKLVNDASLCTKIGTNARDYVAENFSWQKVSEIFVDICQSVARPTPTSGDSKRP